MVFNEVALVVDGDVDDVKGVDDAFMVLMLLLVVLHFVVELRLCLCFVAAEFGDVVRILCFQVFVVFRLK